MLYYRSRTAEESLRRRAGMSPSGPAAILVPPSPDLRYVYLHWTAGDYAQTFPAYHYCIALRDGKIAVVASSAVEANARDVRSGEDAPYAAHVAGRNSYAIGIAICGMQAATPADFGAFPLRRDMLETAFGLVARLCARYAIAIDAEHVRTHAEAAVSDGYFGCGESQRWDVARLRPDARPLEECDAVRVGDELRARIRAHARGARLGSLLWTTLVSAIALWAVLLWHPWIDWFGR